nr:photosystem I P700 apoprotein A2, chloroplastic [Tanacetum cinerariifolium]
HLVHVAIPASRGEYVRWNNFLDVLPHPQGLGTLFTANVDKEGREGALAFIPEQNSKVHTVDKLPLPRYGLDAPPAQAGLSDGYDRTIEYVRYSSFLLGLTRWGLDENGSWEANQASKYVLRSGITPIGLAASGNLFCIIAFSSFQSLVHECDSLAGRSLVTPWQPVLSLRSRWPLIHLRVVARLPLRAIGLRARVLNISLVVRSKPERISDRLEDPVSHAPLAFNSQGEHIERKPALAFSTPTGISLGGSSEPLTLSPDHKPLG